MCHVCRGQAFEKLYKENQALVQYFHHCIVFTGQCFGELQSKAKQAVCLWQLVTCKPLFSSYCLDDGVFCLPG